MSELRSKKTISKLSSSSQIQPPPLSRITNRNGAAMIAVVCWSSKGTQSWRKIRVLEQAWLPTSVSKLTYSCFTRHPHCMNTISNPHIMSLISICSNYHWKLRTMQWRWKDACQEQLRTKGPSRDFIKQNAASIDRIYQIQPRLGMAVKKLSRYVRDSCDNESEECGQESARISR